ncbi:disintegrin and metalloproteinase domain-containing protein 10 [Elysia marginata]|uniref:Disintegrin and metalloproteinase domain-containing protein 10 n=1 Tax=Elysia marginata TaxID=1093978 RepID=A0AAV4J1T3_9GAST|nr:disintegrin and metalloproteinase domain-containing protein 10 [Elysia marginata]
MEPSGHLTVIVCIRTPKKVTGYYESAKLDEYIHDFQPITFNTGELHKQHQRARRSASGHLRLNFKAYDRNFPLRLRRDTEIFSPDHEHLEYDQLKPVDTSFIYSGHVEGVPRSHVHLAIIGGTPRGHVHIPGNTTYHIEPAEQYFDKPNFHSVIYPESRMDKDPFRERRKNDDVGSCGMDRVKEWMDKMARSAIEEPPTEVKREKRVRR